MIGQKEIVLKGGNSKPDRNQSKLTVCSGCKSCKNGYSDKQNCLQKICPI